MKKFGSVFLSCRFLLQIIFRTYLANCSKTEVSEQIVAGLTKQDNTNKKKKKKIIIDIIKNCW